MASNFVEQKFNMILGKLVSEYILIWMETAIQQIPNNCFDGIQAEHKTPNSCLSPVTLKISSSLYLQIEYVCH